MVRSIAIHSFKGGTGKSTISANLAATLALKGRKIGVMDMDLEGPGLHVIFGLDPYELPYTLNDVLTNGVEPEKATVKMNERLHLDKGALYFAPASVKVEEILKSLRSGFELDSFSNAIKKLTEKFALDYLLVDTHPGLEDDTLLAMGVCNNLVVVSRLDQQDMFGTGVLAEVARTLEKPVHLVLNMIPSDECFRSLESHRKDRCQLQGSGARMASLLRGNHQLSQQISLHTGQPSTSNNQTVQRTRNKAGESKRDELAE